MIRIKYAFSVGLWVCLLACGGEPTQRPHKIIDSRDETDPKPLDPALSTDVPTGRAVAYVFDGLLQFTPDAKLTPCLAKSWEVSPDGLVYTFHLRTGVKFHDGRPFLARHVINSFRRVLDPSTKGGIGWPLYPIKGAKDYSNGKVKSIEGLAAPNDSTVVITLSEPLAIFPKMLAMPVASIVPDSVPENFGEHPIGTGPWKFLEWKRSDYLRFVRNPDYFGGAPKVDTLEARIIPEPSTAVAEFESGNVDVLRVPGQETSNWEQVDEKRAMLMSAPSLQMIYVALNTTRGPLRDVRVRRALNHAVDSRMILERLMANRGTLSAGVIPPALPGGDTTRARYDFNIQKAKQLLREAGYPNGVTIELWCSTTSPFPRIAQTIQAYLAEAGVTVKIVQRDAPSAREASRNGKTDMILKTWFADYPDGENFLYPLLHSSNKGVGGNVSFYSNPGFDALVDLSHREQDEAKRNELYKQADALAYADAPMIYMFFYKELYAVQPWLKGFAPPAILNGQRWIDVTISHEAKK